MPKSVRRKLIGKGHSKVGISRQCAYLGINRSVLYKECKGESCLNLELMDLIDKHYLEHPYKGARRMHVYLTKDMGYEVSLNRIERLYYKVMGLQAIIPGPHTSKRCKDHAVYPYLLRDLEITRPNQVWATGLNYQWTAKEERPTMPLLKDYGEVSNTKSCICTSHKTDWNYMS
jgi:putative transposase